MDLINLVPCLKKTIRNARTPAWMKISCLKYTFKLYLHFPTVPHIFSFVDSSLTSRFIFHTTFYGSGANIFVSHFFKEPTHHFWWNTFVLFYKNSLKLQWRTSPVIPKQNKIFDFTHNSLETFVYYKYGRYFSSEVSVFKQ